VGKMELKLWEPPVGVVLKNTILQVFSKKTWSQVYDFVPKRNMVFITAQKAAQN
jgi:hypothetical protein